MALVNPNIALAVQTPSAPNVLGMAATSENILASQQQRQALGQDMERAQYAQAIQKSRDALNFVRTPEDYVAWTQAQFQDPVLSGMLGQMGVTPEQSMERVQRELSQPGGFERLVAQSSASTAQLSDMMTGRINAMAKQRESAAANARTAQEQALVQGIIAGQGGTNALAPQPTGAAPSVNALSAPAGASIMTDEATATAMPTAPTVAPVTAPVGGTMPGAGTTEPGQMPPQTTGRGATVDPRIAQYQELNRLAMQGNKQAEKALKLLKDELELEYKLLGEKSPLAVINMPQVEKTFEDKVGKEGVKFAYENFEKAKEADAIINNVQTGLDILNQGAITGAGANFFVGFNQALKTAGIDFGYADAAANSQAYAAAMAQNVGRIIPMFGAGTGLSNADREYAKQMAAGEITLDEKAIRRILRINEDLARLGIEKHNKQMQKMGAPEYLLLEVPTFNTAKIPPAAIEYLRENPKTKKQFDSMFGYGYADHILGGQGGD